MKAIVTASLIAALAAPFATAAPLSINELLRSVPETATVVVAIDNAALRDVPRVQDWLLQHQRWTGADQDLRRFLADAALDPVHDVDAMVVAVLGAEHATGAVALLAGRYDPAALGAALVARGAESFTIGGMTAYRLPDAEHHARGRAVLAQPSPDLVIVGDEAGVRAALAGPHPVAPLVEKELSAGHVDVRAPFWVVVEVPAVARDRADAAATARHAEGGDTVRSVVAASGTVQRLAAQAFLDDALKVSGVATADTAENAELLRDAVKGAIAAARLEAQHRSPELVDVLRDIRVGVSGREVSVSASLPLALLDTLAAAHRGRHSGDS